MGIRVYIRGTKMIDLKEYLENKLRAVISGWNNEEDLYAISFFVYSLFLSIVNPS